MASSITSAGSASGMDFESIIAATVEAKRAQLENKTTTKLEEANLEVSGIGKFKSALETFQEALESLNDSKGFNTRKITTSQPTENPYFTVTTKDDAANGSYDIAVKQLASTEKVTQNFDADAKLPKGTLTITLPGVEGEDGKVGDPREITIEVADGTTIAQLRRQINDKAGDYGVTASIVETGNGSKLTIDSGISGAQEDSAGFSMSFSSTPLDDGSESQYKANGDKLNYSGSSGVDDGAVKDGWTVTTGKDAIILVDGEEVTSSTNTFDTQISGLEITVNRVTKNADKSTDGNPVYDTYQLDVTQDVDAIVTKVQTFVTAYNTMISTLDSLGKRNTYTDGENNYDGGELAGDSQLDALTRQLQNIMTSLQGTTTDLYSVGLEVDDDGVFSLDATKFKEGIKDNFNAVVSLFSQKEDSNPSDSIDDRGIIIRLDEILEEYTKSNGILDERKSELDQTIKDLQNEENDNELYLEEYEAALRTKYANLDNTIAGYNNSLNYLSSVLG